MSWGDVLRVDQNATVVKAAAGNSDGHAGQRAVVAVCVGDEDQEQRRPAQRYCLHTVTALFTHTSLHQYPHSAVFCIVLRHMYPRVQQTAAVRTTAYNVIHPHSTIVCT